MQIRLSQPGPIRPLPSPLSPVAQAGQTAPAAEPIDSFQSPQVAGEKPLLPQPPQQSTDAAAQAGVMALLTALLTLITKLFSQGTPANQDAPAPTGKAGKAGPGG